MVLGSTAHHTVEAVNGIGDTKLGLEERVDLLVVGQVGFAGDDVLGGFGCAGLDDVTEDELDIGGLGVGEQSIGELSSASWYENIAVSILGQARQQGERPI